MKSLSLFGLLLSLFCGCSQSSMVRVTRHGGLALDSSMVLAVGNISGDQEKEFRVELIKALNANIDFKVLKEQPGQEARSNETYAAIAASLAGKNQTLVLITGRYRMDTYENHVEKAGPDDTKRKYIEKTFTGRFAVNLSDIPGNTLSFSRELQASSTGEKDENWLLNAIVDAIVADPLIANVRSKVIDAFMYELYPHEEVYNAQFFKDSDMPELEAGIAHATLERWDEAIELFRIVPEKYPNNKNLHKAYYDLGIAYKWNNMFLEARENLEKAYLLKSSKEYYDEIQDLLRFEQEYIIRQKEQSQPQK